MICPPPSRCACGCGAPTTWNKYPLPGKYSKYRPGHCTRMRDSFPSGEAHWAYGTKASQELRSRLSEGRRGESNGNWRHGGYVNADKKGYSSGERHWNWKGGKAARIRQKGRDGSEAKRWRYAVYKRDDYTCQHCFNRGGYLNAHHIKPWNQYLLSRFEVANGLTLCRPCHYKIPTNRKVNCVE